MPPIHLPRPNPLSHSLAAYHPPRPRLALLSARGQRLRHASTTSRDNTSNLRPLVLEKPDKFRPPSHPARIRSKTPRSYAGPPLSDEALAAQKTKQYPHMMPPEGSFMHWFLTNRIMHVYISVGVLVSLSGYIFFVDFHSKNKYPDMLPSNSLFFTHPISYVRQYVQVYKLHTQAVSAETAEKRARQIDEARKRREYLRAHDMEQPGLFGFGTVEQEEAAEKRKVREEEKKTIYNEKRIYEEMMKRRAMELGVGDVEAAPVPAASEKRVYLDFEGKPVPVKKWFGIW